MEFLMNLLLNIFEFLGIEQANQIIIFIIIMGMALIYKLGDLAKWVVGIFIAIMLVSLITAIYQIAFDARAQCVFAYDEDKPLFADSSSRLLSWAELREKNCPSLWVARNEIYHRANYCFYSPLGFAYFDNGEKKCDPQVEGVSGDIERRNIKLISRMERRKGCRVPPASCKEFSRVPSSRLIIDRRPLADR
jgi:hypothetical protein